METKPQQNFAERLGLMLSSKMDGVGELMTHIKILSSLTELECLIFEEKHLNHEDKTERDFREREVTWNQVLDTLHAKYVTYNYDKEMYDKLFDFSINELDSELEKLGITVDPKWSKKQKVKKIMRKAYPKLVTSHNPYSVPASTRSLGKKYRELMWKIENDIQVYKILFDIIETDNLIFNEFMILNQKLHLLLGNLEANFEDIVTYKNMKQVTIIAKIYKSIEELIKKHELEDLEYEARKFIGRNKDGEPLFETEVRTNKKLFDKSFEEFKKIVEKLTKNI